MAMPLAGRGVGVRFAGDQRSFWHQQVGVLEQTRSQWMRTAPLDSLVQLDEGIGQGVADAGDLDSAAAGHIPAMLPGEGDSELVRDLLAHGWLG